MGVVGVVLGVVKWRIIVGVVGVVEGYSRCSGGG